MELYQVMVLDDCLRTVGIREHFMSTMSNQKSTYYVSLQMYTELVLETTVSYFVGIFYRRAAEVVNSKYLNPFVAAFITPSNSVEETYTS